MDQQFFSSVNYCFSIKMNSPTWSRMVSRRKKSGPFVFESLRRRDHSLDCNRKRMIFVIIIHNMGMKLKMFFLDYLYTHVIYIILYNIMLKCNKRSEWDHDNELFLNYLMQSILGILCWVVY